MYCNVPGLKGLLMRFLESLVLLPNCDAPDIDSKALQAVGRGQHKVLVDLEFEPRSIKGWYPASIVNHGTRSRIKDISGNCTNKCELFF